MYEFVFWLSRCDAHRKWLRVSGIFRILFTNLELVINRVTMRKRFPFLLVSLVGLISFPGAAARSQEELTVERLLAKPSLEGVHTDQVAWSPDGRFVSYLRKDARADEQVLWLYDVRSKKGAAFISAEELAGGKREFSREELMRRERAREFGTGLTKYFWSPDATTLYLPLNGDVYAVDVGTKAVQRFTSTPEAEFDPKLSPDGRMLAYIRGGEIFVLDLASKNEKKVTSGATEKVKNGISEFVAQEEMGRHTGYWWSPDSRSIAYLQIDNSPLKEFRLVDFLADDVDVEIQEYPKAGEANTIVRVGVVPAAGGTTTWLDLGANTDIYVPRVQWHPDGNHLAVQIQSRNQDTLDLVLYNIDQKTSRRLLREIDNKWVRLHDDLKFIGNGTEFLWSSERDGFKHLYHYHTGNGSLIRQLTQGKWEVEKLVAVDMKRGKIVFTAFEQSPLEKHLYSIGLDGKGMQRLTTSEGHHTITMSPDLATYVDVYSNITRPPLLALMSVTHAMATMIEENRVPELEQFILPKPELLAIPSADGGRDLHAWMIKPAQFDSSRTYPVIMYQYGGPTSVVVDKRWGGVRMLWHRSMAARGYVVFAVDGRGTPRRGREFQNVLHRRLGRIEVEDQLAGVDYLKRLPYIDSTRIMMWGKSYGGFTTCMAMFTTTAFKLGIAVAPVTEWRNYDTHYTERYLEHPRQNPDGYRLSSPVHRVSGLRGKLLVIHGVADDNVHFQDSMLLIEALQKANKQFDFMAYPRSTHSLAGASVGTHWYTLMTRYIQENL